MIFGEKFISAKIIFGESGIGEIRLRRKWTKSIHAPEPLWIWAHLSRVYLMATVSSQKRFNTWRGSLVDALLCICSPILKPFVLIHSSRIPSKYRRITTKHFFLIITGFFFFFFFFFYLLFRWYMNSYTHLLLLQLDMLVIKKRERKKNRNKKLY